MSERTRRDNKAFMEAKRHVLDLITYYYDHHRKISLSEEKNFFYKYGIKMAYKEVHRSFDPPMAVLDRLLIQYDEWAHTGCSNDWMFGVYARAIEDIIDIIQTS